MGYNAQWHSWDVWPKHLERIDETIKDYGGKKEIVDIEALPLSDIFENYGLKSIDYCNIDVEGGEISVLNSIDF